ncbi:cellulose-binding protein, partial [Wangella sp. NEAU-J3]|nr:cellulose-binding protein [Jidongwangia harbinensis]
FVMDNPHIANLGPRSASVAALGGAEVYRALGAGANITYHSDVSDGTHCASRAEWRPLLQQHLQKYLLRSGNAAGTIRMHSKATGNLASWRDWQTPTLTTSNPPSDPPTSNPPSNPPTSNPPSEPPASTPPSNPPGNGSCTTSYTAGTQWNDRFNLTVNVSGSSNWIVTATAQSPQTFQNSWNAATTLTDNNTVLTARPNGNGNSFGFTVLHNGNRNWPAITCRVA